MSISNSVNNTYEFKKNDYPFIYYFNNEQIEWNPKKRHSRYYKRDV